MVLITTACDGQVPSLDDDSLGDGTIEVGGSATDGAVSVTDAAGDPPAPDAAIERPDPEDAAVIEQDPRTDASIEQPAPNDDEDEAVCPPVDHDCGGLEPADAEGLSRFPIVLVHGMGGFEDLGPLDYYFGIPRLLRNAGYAVFVPETDPVNSTPVRAAQLAAQIDQILTCTCAEKLNLIGHSQGAIDIRYLTTAMGYGNRIASLTSIAGPHRGSPVADAALGLIEGPTDAILNALTAAFTGIVYGRPDEYPDLNAALESCSTPARTAYNEAWPDDPDVPIYSYAGLSGLLVRGDGVCDGGELPTPRRGDIPAPEFAITLAFISQVAGPNDGLVPVDSARWGHFRGCLRADHLDQIGQLLGVVDSFDYRRFFRDHAAFLTEQGH